MLQKISAVILTCTMFMATSLGSVPANDATTTSEAYIPSECIIQTAVPDKQQLEIKQIYIQVPVEANLEGNLLTYTETTDYTELHSLLEECESRKDNASKMAEAARNCGYPEDHPIIQLAKEEWHTANDLAQRYAYDMKNAKYAQAWEEYPVATEVWLYLTNAMGYNEYVAAGIIGNMMIECGGFTLNLDWSAVNKYSGCYGLCQWHPRYHQEVQGGDLKVQLEYMYTSFPALISRYAYTYQQNFTYDKFLRLVDAREAAKAFCIIYERPGGYDARRGECAVKAYDYFVK